MSILRIYPLSSTESPTTESFASYTKGIPSQDTHGNVEQ